MNPFRCSNCTKLLGMIEGKAEIKCPKCKSVNIGITTVAWLEENAHNNPPGLMIPCTPDGIIRLDSQGIAIGVSPQQLSHAKMEDWTPPKGYISPSDFNLGEVVVKKKE